jgi:Flp pilus assembly protein TadG
MKLLRSESGQALIELAVIMPMLLLIVSGLVDYSMYSQAAVQMQAAAAVGAAYGAYPTHWKDTAGMESWATYAASNSSMGVSNFVATASNQYSCTAGGALSATPPACSGGANPYMYVQVKTTGKFSALIGFVKLPTSMTLNGYALYGVDY